MKNYAIMKTADLKDELTKVGESFPVTKTGKFDRITAIDILKRAESASDRGERLKSEKVVVVFHNTNDEAGGTSPIFLHVGNSTHSYEAYIPRETEVTLPAYALKIIDDAVEEVLYQVEENGKFVTKTRYRKRFNYTILETYIEGQEEEAVKE